MDQLITRFDAENPCWTAESLALAGEAAAALPDLEAAGLLEQRGGVYSLTEAGAAAFPFGRERGGTRMLAA